jgi:hypothetical protein
MKRSSDNPWNPDSRLAEHWTEHVLRFVSAELEVIEKEGLHSAALGSLRIIGDLAIQLLQDGHENALLKIMTYLKRAADDAIGIRKEIFIWVVKTYDTMGSLALEGGKKAPVDQTFRDLGWLGERLLDKKGIETKPVMHDIDYSTEYEELFNILLSFGSAYSSKHADAYP